MYRIVPCHVSTGLPFDPLNLTYLVSTIVCCTREYCIEMGRLGLYRWSRENQACVSKQKKNWLFFKTTFSPRLTVLIISGAIFSFPLLYRYLLLFVLIPHLRLRRYWVATIFEFGSRSMKYWASQKMTWHDSAIFQP